MTITWTGDQRLYCQKCGRNYYRDVSDGYTWLSLNCEAHGLWMDHNAAPSSHWDSQKLNTPLSFTPLKAHPLASSLVVTGPQGNCIKRGWASSLLCLPRAHLESSLQELLRELPFCAAGDQTASLSDFWTPTKIKSEKGALDISNEAVSKHKIECDWLSKRIRQQVLTERPWGTPVWAQPSGAIINKTFSFSNSKDLLWDFQTSWKKSNAVFRHCLQYRWWEFGSWSLPARVRVSVIGSELKLQASG